MTTILEPGIYPDIPDTAYHQDPCPAPSLSASLIDVLLERSPAHAKAKHPKLTPMEAEEWSWSLGSAVHTRLLLGEPGFVVIDADSYRSAAAREGRDLALAMGKTPILPHQEWEVDRICRAIRTQIDSHPLLQGVLDPDVGREVTVAWQEASYGGIWCRCKPDLLLERRIVDLKITGVAATPEAWGSGHAIKMGYHRRAVWYRRGLRAVLGVMPAYHFCVVEHEPPYALSVFECTDEALDLAVREVDQALATWATCLRHDAWPSYSTDLQWIEPTPSAHYRSEAMLARHAMSRPVEVPTPFIMGPEGFGV